MMVKWSCELQVNVQSQSEHELDIDGRETCFGCFAVEF